MYYKDLEAYQRKPEQMLWNKTVRPKNRIQKMLHTIATKRKLKKDI